MELDRIYSLARKLKPRLHRSLQRAEYIASLLMWERTVSKDSFELHAEIQVVGYQVSTRMSDW